MPQENSNGGVLKSIARRAMLDNGLDPDFAPAVAEQLRGVDKPARDAGAQIRDLRTLLWCSIDNDDSRDLDQLSVAAALDTDQTLTGLAGSVYVTGPSGFTVFLDDGGSGQGLIGCTWLVQVVNASS